MRGAITFVFVMLLPFAAAAQTTTVTITNSACTNPPLPAEIPAPVTPSVAAGSAALLSPGTQLCRPEAVAELKPHVHLDKVA